MAEPLDLTTIADAAPASDDLLRHMLETWQEYRAEVPNEAPAGWGQNIAQLNRVAWMGERMGHVLAEIGRLRARAAELEEDKEAALARVAWHAAVQREQDARVGELDAAFDRALALAEADRPDAVERAWRHLAAAHRSAGQGQEDERCPCTCQGCLSGHCALCEIPSHAARAAGGEADG